MATRGRGVQTRSQVGNRNIPPNPLKQNGQRPRPPMRSPDTTVNKGILGGLFEGVFGSPTVKKTPTPTPQTPPRVTTVSTPAPAPTYTPTGTMQMQGGTRGQPTTTQSSQKTYCMIVYGQKMQLTSDAINWYIDAGVDVRPCAETPTTPTSNGNLEA